MTKLWYFYVIWYVRIEYDSINKIVLNKFTYNNKKNISMYTKKLINLKYTIQNKIK